MPDQPESSEPPPELLRAFGIEGRLRAVLWRIKDEALRAASEARTLAEIEAEGFNCIGIYYLALMQEAFMAERDALSGKFGRRQFPGRGAVTVLEMIGPVGGTHYLARDARGAMKVWSLASLEDFQIFDTREEAEAV